MTAFAGRIMAVMAVMMLLGTTGAASAKVTQKQIEQASTVDQLLALGATKLSAAQFKSAVVGKMMTNRSGWTWIVEANGTTSSEAKDGSWKELGQPWHMKGNSYCTPIEGKMVCRDAYLIGLYLRLSSPDDVSKLVDWTVKIE